MSKKINYAILVKILALCMCVGAEVDCPFTSIDHSDTTNGTNALVQFRIFR